MSNSWWAGVTWGLLLLAIMAIAVDPWWASILAWAGWMLVVTAAELLVNGKPRRPW